MGAEENVDAPDIIFKVDSEDIGLLPMSHDRSACCRFCLEKRSIDATYDLFDQRVDKWLQRDLCQERGKRFIALISTLHKPENKRVSSEK